MDELTLLRELGEEIDTTTGAPAPRTRHLVVSGIAAGGRKRRRAGARSAFTARRAVPVGAALLAGGLAVGLAVGLASGSVPGLAGDDPAPPPVAGESPGAAATTLDARSILLAAARSARTSEIPVPDPDAFVYTRSLERGVSGSAGAGDTTWKPFTSTREAWLSVDGSRNGAVTPSGSTDLVVIRAGESDPAYGGDLPADTAGMRELLYRGTGGDQKGRSADAQAFQAGMAIAQERLLPAGTRAALYEAMAAIPRVTVVQDAETVTGEHGVAVAIRDGVHRDELVFDRGDHRVIGTRSVFLGTEAGLKPGTVMFTNAVLEMAVVDEVRLRPDGTRREGPIQGLEEEKQPTG
jgi:hypothetical protein